MPARNTSKRNMEIVLILHNIRSSYNVGSLFRTADAVGVSKIIISGYSPTPLDKFERENKEISKTALGAEKTILWEKTVRLAEEIKELKKQGFAVVALELHKKAVDYRMVRSQVKNGKIALILGNEVRGVSPELLKKADIVAEIPMNGKKESLNVSVAGAVALFALV